MAVIKRRMVKKMLLKKVLSSSLKLTGAKGNGLYIFSVSNTQYFVTNRLNYVLAKHILYAKGKSAKESTYEMLSLINKQDKGRGKL